MPRWFLIGPSRCTRAVCWALAWFVVSQLALWAWLDCQKAEVRDPLYHLRLQSLQARLAQRAGSPLVLLLGSSRTKYGMRPDVMNLHASSGRPQPVVYNFGVDGLGSIRGLMYLRRLLADGVRPEWLLVETWPPQWVEDGFFDESRLVPWEDEVHVQDLPLLWRFFGHTPTVLGHGLYRCLVPIQGYRARLVEAAAPFLLTDRQVQALVKRRKGWEPPSPDGWFPLSWGPTDEKEKAHALELGRQQMQPLVSPLRIDPRSDTALRELLSECRAHGIKAAVYLMPEHSAARGWYSEQARGLVTSYLDSLRRELSVPVIDTRDWLADADFTDFCHMWQHAAGPFSERFAHEVLQPLLEGSSTGDGSAPPPGARQ